MASFLPYEQTPLNMRITMITKKYPDLAAQLEDIIHSSKHNPMQAQDKIRHVVQTYEMNLANGRLKPKAMCS